LIGVRRRRAREQSCEENRHRQLSFSHFFSLFVIRLWVRACLEWRMR
jgi:hypothetical protein